MCICSAYQDIRDQYPNIFTNRPSLHQIMQEANQRRLGRVLLEFQRSQDQLLQPPKPPTNGRRQAQLTGFFPRLTTVTTASRALGVMLQQVEELRAR